MFLGRAGLLLSLALTFPASAVCEKAIVIGIDGLGPRGMGPANTPNLDALADGTWAPNYSGAIAAGSYVGGVVGMPTEQVTSSGPGWSTILTGVWKNKHGVVDNSFAGRDFDNYPSFFELIEADDASLYTAAIIQWDPIDEYIIDSVDDADTSMDYRALPASEFAVALDAANVVATADVDVMFVHLDDVDGAGHSFGISSPEYRAQVETTDFHVGLILEAVRDRADFDQEAWLIVVVSDHGHTFDGGHGGQSHLERTNALLLSSKGVAAGELPGTPSIADVSATVLTHLGLEVPEAQEGTARGVVAINPDFRDELVVYLPFNASLEDASGAGNDAFVGGGAPAYATGLHDSGLALDGIDDWISLGEPADLAFGATTDFTISMWISAEGNQPSGDPAIMSNKDWATGFNDGWGLFMGGDGDDWKVNQASAGSRGRVDTSWIDVHHISSGSQPRFGHIAAVFDRDGDVRVYRDGELRDARPIEPGVIDALTINIGQDGTGTYGHLLEATIDDLAIWRRTLTADEIAILASGRALDGFLACFGDLDQSGAVGVGDLLVMLSMWGACSAPCAADLDNSGTVTVGDLLELLGRWGGCS
jgi:hypothetical protein